MKKWILGLLLTIIIFILSGCGVQNNDAIIISEICSNNQSAYANSDYDYLDWIELYNPTNEDVCLYKYRLSDDKKQLDKFIFPNVTIKALGYLIVFFDSKNENRDKLIAGFGLSSNGETLYLSMPNKTVIEEITFPSLEKNSTYGLFNGKYEVLVPSPNESNDTSRIYQFVQMPTFSKESGFYDTSFELSISADSNTKIYYTLDSSIPNENSLEYNGSITINDPSSNPNVLKSRTDTSTRGTSVTALVDKALIVRAIAITSDGNKSDVVTKSYFIGKNGYKNKKVISLVTDIKNLTDENTGIYVRGKAYNDYIASGSTGEAPLYNWSHSGREWERDCNFSLLDNGALNFSQNCGMRIHGYGGRDVQIKSLNIYARGCYGNSNFINPIFDGVKYTKTITLKYDRYSNSSEKFRDGFLQSLMANENVDTQKYETAVVFLNGEYWQNYMIMQKYDEDYIAGKYDIPKDDVVIIKEHKLDVGTTDDYKDFKSFVNFVKTTDFKNEKNYRRLEEKLDIDSFIDFYATELYYNHFDFSYLKNIYIWKSRSKTDLPYQDGKWRFMLYDFDYAAVNRDVSYKDKTIRYDYESNSFTQEYLFATDFKDDIFFHKIMKSPIFKEKFIQRFFDLGNTNFSSKNVSTKLISEYDSFSSSIKVFFDNRFEYITKYLAEYANINYDTKKIFVKTDKNVKINSFDIDSDFTGIYLSNYCITVDLKNYQYELFDLKVVSQNGSVLTLKFNGDNPKIIIN